MGMENSVYIGPYAVVYLRPQKFKTVDLCRSPESCPNNEPAGSINFCTKCGIKLENRFKQEKDETFNHYDLIGGDRMWCPESGYYRNGHATPTGPATHMIFMPNIGSFKVNPDEYNAFGEISHDMIDKSLDKFRNEFAKELKILADNALRVDVRWGYFQYCN